MLSFNGNARKTPLRALLDRYKKSPLRDEIEISEGIRPGSWMPWKFLPVCWTDVNTGEGVVLNKGTIVSVMGALSSLTGTIDYPNNATKIPITIDAVTGAVISGNLRNSAYGYEDTMAGLLVPANGGYDSKVYHTAADVSLGTFKPDGSVVTATGSGANVTIPANRPIGVLYKDAYQDLNGRYLNGTQMDKNWLGVLTDGYITVPFVDATKFNDAAWSGILHADGYTFGAAYYTGSTNSVTETSGAYPDVKNLHAFMYTISGVADAKEGGFVMSDLYGKFIPQYSGAHSYSVTSTVTLASGVGASNRLRLLVGANEISGGLTWASGTLTTTGTVYAPTVFTDQTVGKLVEIDFNFPKHNLEYVDTYPGSEMPGTETLGLPNALYQFAYDAAYYGLGGVAPNKNYLLQAVRSGVFGMARIQLCVS